MSSAATATHVTFSQRQASALPAGSYTVEVAQTVNQLPGSFGASLRFAVAAPRFTLPGDTVHSTYPPALGSGPYSNVLPQVVLNTRSLPWAREAGAGNRTAPWLAVLTIDPTEYSAPSVMTVQDLVAPDQTLTGDGVATPVNGTLPAGYLSYPDLNPLGYGETPSDPCRVVDLPLALFTGIVPSLDDLGYLAHLRQSATTDSPDATAESASYAVIAGNRVPLTGVESHALLVSLEGLADYLPDDAGNASAAIPSGTDHVRLVVLHEWSFFNTGEGQAVVDLLANLNADPASGISSLRLPPASAATPNPSAAAMTTAFGDLQTGSLSETDADALVQNAFAMGYVPMDQRFDNGDQSVGWYRGPLAPTAVNRSVAVPAAAADSLLYYDPLSGMFDVSCAAAWQLGQLLALQSRHYAAQLYRWKAGQSQSRIDQAEQQQLAAALAGSSAFSPLLTTRQGRVESQGAIAVPQPVVDFIADLRLLAGLPFAYLVPSDQMLPPESLRWFQLDDGWVDALVDGAFSIGRAMPGGATDGEAQRIAALADAVTAAMRGKRANPRPDAATDTTSSSGSVALSGFLLRSRLVADLPGLQVKIYDSAAQTTQLPILRFTALSADVALCLVEGIAGYLTVSEPPEALHCGVEGGPGAFITTLRQPPGAGSDDAGRQLGTSAPLTTRGDGRTLAVATSAATIARQLGAAGAAVPTFTSAEWALQTVQGAAQYHFDLTGNGNP
ncbi:hypothetical protein [Endothiovibrio diazotrophicus]